MPAARIRELAEGGYIERKEPVVLIGECDPATFCNPYYMIENNGYWVSQSWADGNHLLP
jgi:hypothetical protein